MKNMGCISNKQACVICGADSNEQGSKPLCHKHQWLHDIHDLYKRYERLSMKMRNYMSCDISADFIYLSWAIELRKLAAEYYGIDYGHQRWLDDLIVDQNHYLAKVKSVRDLHIKCGNLKKCAYCKEYVAATKIITKSEEFPWLGLCECCAYCDCGEIYKIVVNDDDIEYVCSC